MEPLRQEFTLFLREVVYPRRAPEFERDGWAEFGTPEPVRLNLSESPPETQNVTLRYDEWVGMGRPETIKVSMSIELLSDPRDWSRADGIRG